MTKVFLSYSRKDTNMMQRVRDDLLAAGIDVWTDEGIEPGTPLWKDAIEKAIEQAIILIVLLSPDSKQSLWVKRELEYAGVQGVKIIPLLVRGDESTAIPFGLIGSQYVNISADYANGIQRVIDTVRASEQLLDEALDDLLNMGLSLSELPTYSPPPPEPISAVELPTRLSLGGINPLRQLRLLVWLFIFPEYAISYREREEAHVLRSESTWLFSTLTWSPSVIALIAYNLDITGSSIIAPATGWLVFLGILIAWLGMGWLGQHDVFGVWLNTVGFGIAAGFSIAIAFGLFGGIPYFISLCIGMAIVITLGTGVRLIPAGVLTAFTTYFIIRSAPNTFFSDIGIGAFAVSLTIAAAFAIITALVNMLRHNLRSTRPLWVRVGTIAVFIILLVAYGAHFWIYYFEGFQHLPSLEETFAPFIR